jgi:hypothetical protein
LFYVNGSLIAFADCSNHNGKDEEDEEEEEEVDGEEEEEAAPVKDASGHTMHWTDFAEAGYSSGWWCDDCGEGKGKQGRYRFCCKSCKIDYCKSW